MLSGKKIIVGITGSIAAYKSAVLVRLLGKAGAQVQVIMTPSAAQFITPLTLSTLTGRDVLMDIADETSWANHVMLGRWADLMVIAPLSCHSMAKMAHGICDNLLMAVYLSATCPVMMAPAMDEDMWKHTSTRTNIKKIQEAGNHIIPVEHGLLASGLTGPGRMAEPEQILETIQSFFNHSSELAGKKVLITAGPTVEPIDPVRFISNHSTGKMGIALAREAAARGAEVYLVHGPIQEEIPAGVHAQLVQTAADMYEACMNYFPETDLAILTAAVADYRVDNPAKEKIKKKEDVLQLNLVKNQDILKTLGNLKKPEQFLVGFALETNNEQAHAEEKLRSKKADMIIMNSLQDAGAGFGTPTNKIVIFDKSGNAQAFPLKHKNEVARDIFNSIRTAWLT